MRRIRSGRATRTGACLAGPAQSPAEDGSARDPRRRRRALGWCLVGFLVWGASGAGAGDGIVALQTAAASCADPTNSDRYIDCGNGTVTDNDTGLVWLRNANCIGAAGGGTGDPPGNVDWYTAMEFVAGLSDLPGVTDPDDCGLSDGSSPGEWRLPSKAEWQAMTAAARTSGCSEPAITNDSRSDCWDQDCSDLGACSFTGVLSSYYWSSSTRTSGVTAAWAEDIHGSPRPPREPLFKDASVGVWPVRGGQ
jgi:hypothetical protein